VLVFHCSEEGVATELGIGCSGCNGCVGVGSTGGTTIEPSNGELCLSVSEAVSG
jgi:hypothetical protein